MLVVISQAYFLSASLKSTKWFLANCCQRQPDALIQISHLFFFFWPQNTMTYALEPLRRRHFLSRKIMYLGLIFKVPCHCKLKSVAVCRITTLFC